VEVVPDGAWKPADRAWTVPAPAVTPDGSTLAVPAPDGTVVAIDLATGSGARRWIGGCTGCELVHFDASGEHLHAFERKEWTEGDASLCTWPAAGGMPSRRWSVGKTACWDPDRLFAPDGSRALTWNKAGEAVLWDCTVGSRIADLRVTGEAIVTAAWSADSATVAVGTKEGSVWTWSGRDGRGPRDLTPTAPRTPVGSLDFDPRGRHLAVGHDRMDAKSCAILQIIDLASGNLLASLPQSRSMFSIGVMTLAHAPDGDRLFSTDTGELYEWNLDTLSLAWLWQSESCGDEFPMRMLVQQDGTRVALVGQPCRAGLFDVVKGKHIDRVPTTWRTRYAESVKLGRFVLVEGPVVMCLETRSLRELYRRTQFEGDDEVIVTPEGWFTGTVGAIHRARIRGSESEEHVLERMAPWALDPKRVRAAAAGIELRPLRKA
jgi:WD40 repeat protein